MKINLKTAAIVLLTALAACGVLTCVNQNVKTLGAEAELTALTIGNVEVSAVPAPINSSSWNADIRSLFSEDFSSMEFQKEDQITNVRLKPTVSRGAEVQWSVGSKSYCSDDFNDIRVPATFESDEFIYIKVTSEDLTVVNYYRFYTRVFSWVTDLASISIAGREAKSISGADSYDKIAANATGAIFITTGEASNALITPVIFDPNSTVRFARAKGTAAPEFSAMDTPLSFDDQDYLYVEITAENTIDKAFFKFRVHVGRMATIKSLKLNNGAKDIELFGLGLPSGVWASVGPGEYATAWADQPVTGFNVNIELDDPDGRKDYDIITSIPASAPGAYGNAKKPFSSGNYLVIRVRSLNGNVTNYYHIKVTLLAANIKAHPKSAWYYASYVTNGVTPGKQTVQPLTIEFPAGTDETNFNYQWYTADSLFGIYGRHEVSMDEKQNISTINGGPDMYYYLSQPGVGQYGDTVGDNAVGARGQKQALAWKITTGGTSKTYTPPNNWKNVPVKLPIGAAQNSSYPYEPSNSIYKDGTTADTPPDQSKWPFIEDWDTDGWPVPADNHVNFFGGATSEVRYYWVVVTDTSNGYTVTSDRAVILTETNPKMDHYIFELSALPVRKNVQPFKVLRELYKIEIPAGYFPANFDPSKYEICVAQAQYYLPDGRPWTQNWTHGDLHFGYKDNTLTWWQNNLGANSGAIPLQTPHSAQGGLTSAPDWVGFAPSGDKNRGLPPTVNGKLPVGYKPSGFATGQAQGYFCGFIELMELRFAIAPTD